MLIHISGCPNCAHVCNKKMLEKLKILFPRLPQKKLEEVLAEGDSKYCIYSIVFCIRMTVFSLGLFAWCTPLCLSGALLG